jgi:hypothetical protein
VRRGEEGDKKMKRTKMVAMRTRCGGGPWRQGIEEDGSDATNGDGDGHV